MVTGGVLRCVFLFASMGSLHFAVCEFDVLFALCVCVYCVHIVYIYVQHEMSRVMVFVSLESVNIWLSYGEMKF